MMQHNTINQQIRETCRACHNVCYVSADADGNAPPVPAEGYRCEACEEARYERRDFDKSLPPLDAGSAEGVSPAAEPEGTASPSPSAESAATTSEARPSADPKSGDGEVVEVS